MRYVPSSAWVSVHNIPKFDPNSTTRNLAVLTRTFLSYFLAGAILSLHYESLYKRCGSVAVPVVYGHHSRGKSNFMKIALGVCGNLEKGLTTYLSPSSSRTRIAGSLPFAYDDPSASEAKFKQMIIECFGGASVENARHQMVAHCVPLISANVFIIDKLTMDEPQYVVDVKLLLTLHILSYVRATLRLEC